MAYLPRDTQKFQRGKTLIPILWILVLSLLPHGDESIDNRKKYNQSMVNLHRYLLLNCKDSREQII